MHYKNKPLKFDDLFKMMYQNQVSLKFPWTVSSWPMSSMSQKIQVPKQCKYDCDK